MTTNEFFDLWANEIKTTILKPSTLHCYRVLYRLYVENFEQIGNAELSAVTKLDIAKLLNALLAKGLTPGTCRKIKYVLSGLFSDAEESELVSTNPCRNVPIRQPRTERRVLTREEETLLLEELKYTRLYPIVRFMLQTGLRVGEATALRFSDINMKDGTLLVARTHVYMPDPSTHAMTDVFQEPKTKASMRVIPLLPDTVALLKNQMAVRSEETRKAANLGTLVNIPEAGFLVFATKRGGPLRSVNINDTLANTVKRINSRLVDEGLAPIAPISCHALRHTFATRAFECGVKPKAVQKLLGHVSLQTTMDLYTHVTDDTLRSELMKMKKALKPCIP